MHNPFFIHIFAPMKNTISAVLVLQFLYNEEVIRKINKDIVQNNSSINAIINIFI